MRALRGFVLAMCCMAVMLGGGSLPPLLASAAQVTDDLMVNLPAVYFRIPPVWLGPDGGLIAALVIDSQNPQNVYAGSWGGGVYKSTDGGANWLRSSAGLDNLVINALGIDPQNPAVIYAGTYKGKMYKSVDAGATWFFSSQGIQEEAIVYSIVVDHANPSNVYIATRGVSNDLDRPWNGVVYKSTDAGASWAPSLDDLGGSSYEDWVYALAMHPDNPSILYAATHEHGPLRTRDGGSNWKIITDGITNFSTRAIGVVPGTSPGVVYTGVWTKDGVFKSNDGGDTWKLKDDGLIGANLYNLSIDPQQSGTVYLAAFNMGVMKTTNGGNSWFNAGLPDSPVGVVQVSPGDDHTVVFAGTSGEGLYASRDGGSTWQHSQAGLTATSVTGLAFDNQSGWMLSGVYGGGVLRSENGGITWDEINTGLGDRFVHTVVRRPGSRVFYAITHDHGLYRRDLGSAGNWVKISSNLPASPAPLEPVSPWEDQIDPLAGPAAGPLGDLRAETAPAATLGARLLSMVFATSDANIAYIGTDGSGVYKSTDGGEHWSFAGLSGYAIRSLLVDPGDPQHLFAASVQAGSVKTSTNGGASWSDLSLPGVTFYGLALAGSSPLAATGSGAYRYDGAAWQPVGLAGTPLTVIAVDPDDPAVWYAAGTTGAYMSSDAGVTWQPGPEELQDIAVQAITFDPYQYRVVYYCTRTHGILRVNY